MASTVSSPSQAPLGMIPEQQTPAGTAPEHHQAYPPSKKKYLLAFLILLLHFSSQLKICTCLRPKPEHINLVENLQQWLIY